MKRKITISKDEAETIKRSVTEAEKRTSGEIVPVIVAASDPYWEAHAISALFGWVIGSAWLSLLLERAPFALSNFKLLLWQFVFLCAGFLMAFLTPVKRLFLFRSRLAIEVHRQCLAHFMELGLNETKDRTGVLIFLSELERRVEILADRGINKRTEEGYWKEQVDHIVKGIHAGRTALALCEVIEVVGKKLATTFPKAPDDKNELPDDLV